MPSWSPSGGAREVGFRGPCTGLSSSWSALHAEHANPIFLCAPGDFIVDDEGRGYMELGEEDNFWQGDGEEDEQAGKGGKKRKGDAKGACTRAGRGPGFVAQLSTPAQLISMHCSTGSTAMSGALCAPCTCFHHHHHHPCTQPHHHPCTACTPPPASPNHNHRGREEQEEGD